MKIENQEESNAMNPLIKLSIIIVFFLVIILVYFLYENFEQPTELAKNNCSLLSYQGKVSPELEPLLINLNIQGYPFEEKKAELEQIAKSEDPKSYSILATIANCKSEVLLQYPAIELLIKKIKAQGDVIGARELGRWFEKIRATQINPTEISIFQSLLEVFNKNKDLEYRKKMLAEIFASDPQLAMVLATALNFDEGEKTFSDLLKAFIAQSSPGLDIEGRSMMALIMGNMNLAKSFEMEIKDTVSSLSDQDLLWVLKPLVALNNSLLPIAVSEIQKRNLFDSSQKAILEPVFTLNNSADNNKVKEALLNIAIGKADHQGLTVIGRWYSPAAEKVLLLAIPITKDPELSLLAFDILAGRSIEDKTTEILVRWLKSKHWEKRKEVFSAIAVLSAFEYATKEDLEKALDKILSFVKDDSFFETIIETKQEKLILPAIPKFENVTSPDILISLLKYKNKDIRIAAVKALKGHNEVMFLSEILDAYRSENNEEVRKVYQDNHWVTENRGSEIKR